MNRLITLGVVTFFLFLAACAIKLAADMVSFKGNRLPAIERQLEGIEY